MCGGYFRSNVFLGIGSLFKYHMVVSNRIIVKNGWTRHTAPLLVVSEGFFIWNGACHVVYQYGWKYLALGSKGQEVLVYNESTQDKCGKI